MANTLNKTGIENGGIVEAYHITQSIDAFTGLTAYDISLSGSFNMTGSINGEPGVINQLTSSYALTASYALSTTPTYTGNVLLSGGASWSNTGMIFNVTDLSYVINNVLYDTPGTSVTLANGDPSFDRFDAIVVDDTETISVITGTPAINPVVPIPEPNQVLIQYVFVAQGVTTPSIVNEYVYREGSSPDWISSVVGTGPAGPTASFSFTGPVPTPFDGTSCLQITSRVMDWTNRYVRFTAPSPISRSAFAVLSMRVYLPVNFATLDGNSNGRRPIVSLMNGTTYLGNVNLDQWGLNRTQVGTWQLVTIPLSAFTSAPTLTTITSLRLYLYEYIADSPLPAAVNIYYDDIKFQSGFGPQTNTATIDILDDNTVIGSTAKLNFTSSTSNIITATQDIPNNRINIKIDSTVSTGSFITTSSFNNYTGSNTSQFAGTSSFAMTASSLNITNINTGTTYYPVFVLGQVTNNQPYIDKTTFSYNAVTDTLNVTSSVAITASHALTASYTTNLTFPYTGSALITGSLGITGSFDVGSIFNVNSNTGIEITAGRTILPSGNRTLNLGSGTRHWQNIYTQFIRLADDSGDDQIRISAPVLASSPDPAWEFILPAGSGSAGQVLAISSSIAGAVSTVWTSSNISSGGTTWYTSTTQAYTIPTGTDVGVIVGYTGVGAVTYDIQSGTVGDKLQIIVRDVVSNSFTLDYDSGQIRCGITGSGTGGSITTVNNGTAPVINLVYTSASRWTITHYMDSLTLTSGGGFSILDAIQFNAT
jgi:hypothetical protein